MTEKILVPVEHIEHAILVIRGHKVLLDADLAALYGVETKTLNRAVNRNSERFPVDFMFQLTAEEAADLRCHFGTSNGRGGRRYLPYVFTEQGVAMLSSVLRSPPRCAGEHRDHACLRAPATNAREKRRTCPQARRA